MRVYDIKFSDGKGCRCIVSEPLPTTAEDKNCISTNFHKGYVAEINRIIPDAPGRLPWMRSGKGWSMDGFTLEKLNDGQFRLSWLGGELVSASKEEISAAVRKHWAEALK